jgi:hypothetical protein
MKNRRRFLSLLSLAPSAGIALAMGAEAAAAPSHASAAALAIAATFRRFDPQLDDAEIARIAQLIDDNRANLDRLHPKGKPLANSAEPATRFAVHAGRPD